MVTTRDEPGLRALHLSQAIMKATDDYAEGAGSHRNVAASALWREQIFRLCAEHFAEADRAIEQLVRNAAEMAARPGVYPIRNPEAELTTAVHRIYQQYGQNLQAFFEDVQKSRTLAQAGDKGDDRETGRRGAVDAGLLTGLPASIPGERG